MPSELPCSEGTLGSVPREEAQLGACAISGREMSLPRVSLSLALLGLTCGAVGIGTPFLGPRKVAGGSERGDSRGGRGPGLGFSSGVC